MIGVGVSATGSAGFSPNAETVDDLAGPFRDEGASIGQGIVGGADHAFDSDTDVYSVTLGIAGPRPPVEFHAYDSDTWVAHN